MASSLLDPEIDDRRALDDRVVTDDDHHLGVGNPAERKPERLEYIGGRFREDGRMGIEPLRRRRPKEYASSVVSDPENAW
jgi:hypothetical protein